MRTLRLRIRTTIRHAITITRELKEREEIYLDFLWQGYNSLPATPFSALGGWASQWIDPRAPKAEPAKSWTNQRCFPCRERSASPSPCWSTSDLAYHSQININLAYFARIVNSSRGLAAKGNQLPSFKQTLSLDHCPTGARSGQNKKDEVNSEDCKWERLVFPYGRI